MQKQEQLIEALKKYKRGLLRNVFDKSIKTANYQKFIGQKLSWERFVHTDVAASPNLMDYPYGMMRKMVCRLFRLQM